MLLRRLAVWLSVPQLVSWGTLFYSFSVFLGPVEKDLGLTRFESSAAFSLALLAEGLAAWPVGRWIDRGHGRAVMAVGSLLAATGLSVLSGATGAAALYGSWMLIGASMAMVLYNPCFAILIREFPRSARRGITAITLVGGLASTVFIPLTLGLESAWGWRTTALLLAGLNLVLCLPIHAVALRGPNLSLPRHEGLGKRPKVVIENPRRFRLVGAFLVLVTAVVSALPVHLVSLLQGLSLDSLWIVAVPASVGVAQVAGRLVLFLAGSGWNEDRTDGWVPWAIPLSLALLLVAAAVPSLSIAALVLFVVIFGAGNGLLTVVKSSAVHRYVQTESTASLNGALGVPLALARAGTPLLVGWLWNPQSGYSIALLLLLALGLAGALALQRVRAEAPAEQSSG